MLGLNEKQDDGERFIQVAYWNNVKEPELQNEKDRELEAREANND